MIFNTIEIVSCFYKQKYPNNINRGQFNKNNSMLYILLKDINRLSCKDIGILTNRGRSTINKIQNKVSIRLNKGISLQNEYKVLTELINQRNKEYERLTKLS